MSEIDNQHEINQSYWFKWNDYQNHLSDVVRQLLEEDCMVDVTLAAAGERIHAHRIVLCACSTLFRVNHFCIFNCIVSYRVANNISRLFTNIPEKFDNIINTIFIF